MKDVFEPVSKQSLSDRLALRIRELIQSGNYQEGDRLPAIMEMARQFGVGHPTIREALKKLETMGIVEIRHGSGVYVTRSEDVLLLAAPDYAGTVTKKLLLDLVRTRMPLEVQSVTDAVRHGTPEHIAEMRRLLDVASHNFANGEVLHTSNMGFHQQIALASGNRVLAQMLAVLQDLFTREQQLILNIHGPRERDHQEHLGILDAIEKHDEPLAIERMRKHLQGVETAVLNWDPERHPVTELRGIG
jgi:GntR family transcriptional regulator, transcriptional repressor for pyruvate dehydrogenase complex